MFQMFELVACLKVNFHKSVLVGVNVEKEWLEEVAGVLHCKVGSFPMKYLGLPIGVNSNSLEMWELVLEVICKRLSSWFNKHVSSVGGNL